MLLLPTINSSLYKRVWELHLKDFIQSRNMFPLKKHFSDNQGYRILPIPALYIATWIYIATSTMPCVVVVVVANLIYSHANIPVNANYKVIPYISHKFPKNILVIAMFLLYCYTVETRISHLFGMGSSSPAPQKGSLSAEMSGWSNLVTWWKIVIWVSWDWYYKRI